MTESQFINKNRDSWQSLESLLLQKTKDADNLQRLFVKVSSDLSYARTFYPNRSVRLYLNNLTLQVFDLISERRKIYKFKDLIKFFTDTLPLEVYHNRKLFYISFIIFSFSMLVGVISSIHNPEFANVILGDRYINMTENNINDGDPMAVYKNTDQFDMFMGITINNIRVAFIAFILGLLGGIGTVFVLVSNGVMVGVFQYFFYSKGLFLTSFLTIWIHGTFEISAIIIAGASGMILGNGLLFPKTHTRTTSLLMSTEKALIIVLGVVPLFVIAGLLESFVTRLTDLPSLVKIFIIVCSLLVVLIMWVFYPLYCGRYKNDENREINQLRLPYTPIKTNRSSVYTFLEILSISFGQYRIHLGYYIQKVVLPILFLSSIIYWLYVKSLTHIDDLGYDSIELISFSETNIFIGIFHWMSLSYALCVLGYLSLLRKNYTYSIMKHLRNSFFKIAMLSFLVIIAFYVMPFWWFAIAFILFFPSFTIFCIEYISNNNNPVFPSIQEGWFICWSRYFHFLPSALVVTLFMGMMYLLFQSSLASLIVELIGWHNIFESYIAKLTYTTWIFNLCILLFSLPIFYFLYSNHFYSEKCKNDALDLKEKFESFGEPKTIFEL